MLQDKYPFVQITLPQREEVFVMQTKNPQWVIQIISFASKEKYDSFIKERYPGTYTPNEKYQLIAMAVSPMQAVNITSTNMKEENAIQEQAEIDALAWWISQNPEKKRASIKKIASNLRIGEEIANWKNDAFIQGIYDEQVNRIPNLPSGKVYIHLHTHGIRIKVDFTYKYDIHYSQITNIEKTTSAEIIQSPKFAYGKAFIGGAFFGPLGIYLGGISGSKLRSDVQVNNFLIIDYITPDSEQEKSIVIYCNEKQAIEKFIKRQQKESHINETKNRPAGKDRMPLSIIIFLLFIPLIVIATRFLFICMFHLHF